MFYKKIKSLREDYGISQNKLAEQLQISRSALSLYEIGKREPDFETIKKISNFFNVSIDYLLDNSNNNFDSAHAHIPEIDNARSINKYIGNNIKQSIVKCKLTESELAEAVGLKESDIIDIENGSVKLDIIMVEKIARVLKLHPGNLVGWNDNTDEIEVADDEVMDEYEDLKKKMVESGYPPEDFQKMVDLMINTFSKK